MGSRGASAAPRLMLLATLAAAIPFLAMLQVTSGSFHRPEGGEDGIYMATVEVDEQGVEQHVVKYLGKGNTTRGSWAAADDVVWDSGAHCQWGFMMDDGDIHNAVTALANYFGDAGRDWNINLSAYSGSAIAYACDYYGRQWTNTHQYMDEHAIIDARCGPNTAGWFARESWYRAFGRTVLTVGFC